MKKVLLGTSAIALVGAFATQASANEWQVRVGGYMEQYGGYAHNDVNWIKPGTDASGNTIFTNANGNYNGVDQKSDSEIWFLPKITLDNGLQFGGNVQLEGNTSSDQIDESYMFIKGSFGEIDLGSENSAGYKMTYAAPDVTFIGANSGSLTQFVPFSGPGMGADVFRGTLGSSYIEVGRNNDAQRFTYYTPRFAGFQVGASYARDGNQDSFAQLNTDTTLHDIVDVGANYVNSFGAVNVAISGRYGFGSAAKGGQSDPQVWAAGANLGYGGFTVGGSYAHSNDYNAQGGRFFDAGVSYETGPWGFSFTYSNGKNQDNDCNNFAFGGGAFTCVGSTDEELKQYLAGVSYKLAKGVTLGAFGAYVDYQSANLSTNGGETTFHNDVKGWVLGSGVRIAF